ncbi:ABC transporter permease [Vallitalea pronyensis]|uniref:ABC transporter permease n=1 Tax=Vallitalea pronyensis TaxID=1348613 RepID=A0A8J8MH32_9FIRM|nr:ABC transporter permease [Vallitalea pronyensis]QUI21128.1 ABC transporter permease [Vallitalea pronyensis]
MTFRDIVIKNFKYNFRQYIAYFLCSSFNVLVLTMYATFYYNDSIVKNTEGTVIEITLRLCLFALVIFCFMFISYVNGSFMRGRNAEFGLFLTLGMRKKDIEKTIRVENVMISTGSFIVGIVAGSVLSRLFFMAGVSILEFDGMTFMLNPKAYGLTFLLFMVINSFMYIKRKFYMRQLALTELMKDTRRSQQGKSSWVIGLLGLVMVGGAYGYIHYAIQVGLKGNDTVILVLVLFSVGLYLVISHFGALMIKSSKKRYYKHIIGLSTINYRFIGYRKILFSVTILSCTVVFFVGVIYSVYVISRDMTSKYTPYDVVYMEMADRDNLSRKKLYEIIDQESANMTEAKTLDFIQSTLHYPHRGEIIASRESFVSESAIKDHLHQELTDIKAGQVVSIRSRDEEVWGKSGEILKIKEGNNPEFTYTVREEIYEVVGNESFSRLFRNQTLIVLDDDDYTTVMHTYGLAPSTLHMFNFKDDPTTEKVLRHIIRAQYGEEKANERIFRYRYEKYFHVSSNLVEMKAGIAVFGFTLFITGLIGILFFISSGVMLYFKVYTSMEEAKVKYAMLYKTGIMVKEIKQAIADEIKPVFFIPVILGGLAGLGFIALLYRRTGIYDKLLMNTAYLVLIYTLFTGIFYIITKRKYTRTILAHLKI